MAARPVATCHRRPSFSRLGAGLELDHGRRVPPTFHGDFTKRKGDFTKQSGDLTKKNIKISTKNNGNFTRQSGDFTTLNSELGVHQAEMGISPSGHETWEALKQPGKRYQGQCQSLVKVASEVHSSNFRGEVSHFHFVLGSKINQISSGYQLFPSPLLPLFIQDGPPPLLSWFIYHYNHLYLVRYIHHKP